MIVPSMKLCLFYPVRKNITSPRRSNLAKLCFKFPIKESASKILVSSFIDQILEIKRRDFYPSNTNFSIDCNFTSQPSRQYISRFRSALTV